MPRRESAPADGAGLDKLGTNVNPTPNPWPCPSCQAQWPGSARFCASCGEQRLPVARGALRRAVARWWLTLKLLITSPGALTVRQRDGRRQGLVPPLTLFLTLNLVFFLGQSLSGLAILSIPLRAHVQGQFYSATAANWTDKRLAAKQAAKPFDRTRFSDAFDLQQQTLAKASVVAMVPVLALVCGLAYGPRRRGLAVHVHFALHFYAFALLYVTALYAVLGLGLLGLRAAHVTLGPDTLDIVASTCQAAVLGWYLSRASGRVYGLGLLARVLISVPLVTLVFGIMLAHRFLVFGLTLWLV